MRFPRWLNEDTPRRRRAPRHRIAGIVAYYWDGGAPKEHLIRDISLTGAYVCATESWYIGTILTMTIRHGVGGEDAGLAAASTISIPCKVVRQDSDGGVGVRFMFARSEHRKAMETFVKGIVRRSGAENNPEPAKGHAR